MKILIVNDYSVLSGGAERVSLILRDGMRARGHEARLFASSARPATGDNPADYICFGTESPLRRILQVMNPLAVRKLSQVLADYQPDIVHVRMFLTQLSPFILPLLRAIPTIYHVGNYQAICPINTKLLPDNSTCRHLAGRACYRDGCVSLLGLTRVGMQLGAWRRWRGVFKLIVANSKWLAQRLRADGVSVDEVVWNGTRVRAPRPPLANPPIISYAGRLVAKKGVDVLLHALAQVVVRIPAIRLIIAGDGPARREIESLISNLSLGAHVTMLGHLDSTRLDEALAPTWVHVVPSIYEEPFPNVAIEAMMRGVAVVATATGGSSEIVHHSQTGYLVIPGDPASLSHRLSHLLANEDLAERMGAAGRAVALAEFTEEQMLDRFLGIYSRVREQRPAVP